MSTITKSLTTIRQEIAAARATAEQEAREEARAVFGRRGVIRSRGVWLSSIDRRGMQCAPFEGALASGWDGTLRSLQAAVAKIEREHPECVALDIEGGHDAAENLTELLAAENYLPWASGWQVRVWERPAAVVAVEEISDCEACGSCGDELIDGQDDMVRLRCAECAADENTAAHETLDAIRARLSASPLDAQAAADVAAILAKAGAL